MKRLGGRAVGAERTSAEGNGLTAEEVCCARSE